MGIGLSDLGSIVAGQLNEQFGFGENQVVQQGKSVDDLLGDFVNKIDKTADRTYVEDGFVRNIRPRLREIFWQEPNIAILVKKRMFSSLADNSRLDLLEDKERLLIRASKMLFQKKCQLMSAYERLTKIERVAVETGEFNTHLAPMLLNDIETLERAGINMLKPEDRAAFDVLRKALAFSEPSSFTNWATDHDGPFQDVLGEGTGVIELTTIGNLSTTVSTRFGGGRANLTIEDPYKILVVTNDDIDAAIADATNFFKNTWFGTFTESETQGLIDRLRNQLNRNRRSQGQAEIRFMTNPTTLLSKRVRAMMDSGEEIVFSYEPGLVGLGSSVEIGDPRLKQGDDTIDPALIGRNALTAEDQRLFKDIVSNIYLLLGFQSTTQSEIASWDMSQNLNDPKKLDYVQDINYVRNRMRLFFANKPIIQPMDVVEVFMSTKTMTDEKLTQGFENINSSHGFRIGQLFDNLIRNINATLNDLSGTKTSSEDLEKNAIVGPDFPDWLWKMFRNDFTQQSAGSCVFVGLVNTASHNYSDGRYTLSVQCDDNTSYFNRQQINFKPALDVFNSQIYDPLTPFDVSFDAATGVPINEVNQGQFPPLLPENEVLMHSKMVRFKSMSIRGHRADPLLYQTSDEEVVFGNYRQVLSDPDGMVYRWKQGIQSLTKQEPSLESSVRADRSPLLTKEPFAGQDVMNVLSLLVTGEPYNYNTFLKAAIENGNTIVKNDPTINSSSVVSYIESLIGDLSKRNAVWGNFIPYKKLVINEEADAFIRSGQGTLRKLNQDLRTLSHKRAQIMDDLAVRYSAQVVDDRGEPVSPDAQIIRLEDELRSVNAKLEITTNRFSTVSDDLIKRNDDAIRLIGNDISYDPSVAGMNTDVTEDQRRQDRQEFRRKINTLVQRRYWKSKANEDQNLFVVDDQYDNNYDIQAFERKLGPSLNLFASEYATIDHRIRATAAILGLEIFADSQGNIQVRPPLYNRVPSSVFYNMFKERDRTGLKVFPDFLESLYRNQLIGVIRQIEIIEDEIRLRGTALGLIVTGGGDADARIRQYLRGANEGSAVIFGVNEFSFVSDPSTGRVGMSGLNSLIYQSNPDISERSQTLKDLGDLQAKANQTRIFDPVARIFSQAEKATFQDVAAKNVQDRLKQIADRLAKLKGDPPQKSTISDFYSDTRFEGGATSNQLSELDTLGIKNELAQLVSQRQELLVSLTNAVKSLVDGIRTNDTQEGANRALTPALNRKRPIPELLEHMIEDEDLDDFGHGSGKRFVIKDSQVVRLSVTEKPPDYTVAQVNGLVAEGIIDPVSKLQLSNGGFVQTTAYAVDYDMWYMYGFKDSKSIPAPFFSDPESQCAPLAVFALNLARRNILQGTVEVSGYNEFYQAGDVVYIEDRDLLFYVESVAHNFNYGGLSTTLTLSYGHNPGEYIPTMLDIVGKILYNAKGFSGQYRSSRFDPVGGDQSIGSVIFNPRNPIFSFSGQEQVLTELLAGSWGEQNRNILSSILLATTGILNAVGYREKRPIIELRYYQGTPDFAAGIDFGPISAAAEAVKAWLINPGRYTTLSEQVIGEKVQSFMRLANEDIRVVPVSSEDNEDVRSPSRAAWNAVRNQAQTRGIGRDEDDTTADIATELDKIMATTIIDAWIVLEDIPASISTNGQDRGSQAGQEELAQLEAAMRTVGY